MRNFKYDTEPIIETTGGKVHGYAMGNIHIFKGIPYAQAERFKAPVEVQWEGVRQTASYGYVCRLVNQDQPSNELVCPHMYWPQSEHCQNLNIWTPALDENAKKPVLVWFHGGGYFAGSSIEQLAYDGTNMAEYGDAVVVSVNHRLNIFGYLDVSCLGDEYENSGNAGNMDLIAALKWVHNNIRKFGGNPECVTIFGQSGGGMKVTDLMNMPEADGLFHRVFAMSGVADEGIAPIMPENKEGVSGKDLTEAIIKQLGAKNPLDITKVSEDDLMRAYKAVNAEYHGEYHNGTPMINSHYKGWPALHGFRKESRNVPLLIGSVFGEFGSPLKFDRFEERTEEEKRALVEKVYGKNTDAIISEFRKIYPDKDLSDLVYYDRVFRIPSIKTAREHVKNGGIAYLYHYTYSNNYMNHLPAWHCSDIPLVFHNCDKVDFCADTETVKLQDTVFAAVMNFARTGNPNGNGVPSWNEVGEKNPTMVFDRECGQRDVSDEAMMQLMDEVAPRFNMGLFEDNQVQH